MPTYHSKDVICLNAAQDKVVPCDSEEAAFRLVGQGGEVTPEDAKKYDLVKAGLVTDGTEGKKAPAPAEEEPTEAKAVAAPAENKARTSAAKK